MATDPITVKVEGERRVTEYLAKLRQVADDNSPIWREIGEILHDGVMDRFDREQAPDGTAWQKSWRARLQGGKTLQSTGRLRDSIQMVVQGSSVKIKTNVKYARVHQFGATIRAKGGGYLTFKGAGNWAKVRSVVIPARPFLGMSKDDEQGIILTIEGVLLDVKP